MKLTINQKEETREISPGSIVITECGKKLLLVPGLDGDYRVIDLEAKRYLKDTGYSTTSNILREIRNSYSVVKTIIPPERVDITATI